MRHSGFKRITASLALCVGVGIAGLGAYLAPDEWFVFVLTGAGLWLLAGFAAQGKYKSACALGRFQKEDGRWESDAEVELRIKVRPNHPIIHFLWPFMRHERDGSGK